MKKYLFACCLLIGYAQSQGQSTVCLKNETSYTLILTVDELGITDTLAPRSTGRPFVLKKYKRLPDQKLNYHVLWERKEYVFDGRPLPGVDGPAGNWQIIISYMENYSERYQQMFRCLVPTVRKI